MRLCIPVKEGEGLGAEICDHFGSAAWFTLYDQKTRDCETIQNTKAGHGRGQCRPVDLLENRDVIAVICRKMGRSAFANMERAGIKVYTTQGTTVQDAIDDFLAGRLIKLDLHTGCTGRHDHGTERRETVDEQQ